jgi:hypothetical protein
VVTLLAAYAGMIVADRWGEALYHILTKQSGSVLNEQFVSGNISVLTVQIALFAIVMLIIALKGGVLIHPDSVGVGFMSYLVLIGYGLLTAALIASALLGFVPKAQLDQIYESSKIAKQLVDYQAWLLVFPLMLMMISGWGQKN